MSQLNRFINYLVLFGIVLIPLLSSCSPSEKPDNEMLYGAIVRGNTAASELALVFTGDEFADGGFHIIDVLSSVEVKASFFLTGKIL